MKNFTLHALILALCAICGFRANAQLIMETGVGDGTFAFNGDGLPAMQTQINSPYDVCLDAAGNVYFTDHANGRIRMVSVTTGLVSTIAGGGTATADGVPATSALIAPYYICVDVSGNIFFSERGDIKKVAAGTGILTTVAGNGTPGYSGDGGLATAATIQGSLGICTDAAGNLYLADGANNRIREVAAATGIISTIAGTGTAGYTGDGAAAASATLNCPTVICIDHSGNLFFADQGAVDGTTGTPTYGSSSNFIREINAGTGNISTRAGNDTYIDLFDCSSDSCYLGWVTGVCCDDSGDVYCNEISCSCRRIDMHANRVYPIAGNFSVESYDGDGGNSLGMWMDNPYGITVDHKRNVYIADNLNSRIRMVLNVTHTPTFSFGHGQSFQICQGQNFSLNKDLTFTDLDLSQNETLSVLNAPAHGTLTGLSYSMLSTGEDTVDIPNGLSYTANSDYSGTDAFEVMVSDGTNADTVTLYAMVAGAPAPISGTSAICLGSTATLNDDSTGTWSASSADISITPSGTSVLITADAVGSVTLSYTNSNTCGTGTVTQVIAVQAVPDPGTISGGTVVSTATPVMLTDAAMGGTWSSTDNAVATVSSTGIVYGIEPGTDSIYYTITNACGSYSAGHAITVKYPEGINNVTANSAITIAPNPASSAFTINAASSYDEPLTVTILDVSGAVVKTLTGTTNNTINAQLNAPAGIYLINISGEHVNNSSKLILQ